MKLKSLWNAFQFGSKADRIYCGPCYDAQFATRCDGCNDVFRAGQYTEQIDDG